MKIFVSGANGFIGDRLCGKLAAQGHEVHALVRHDPSIIDSDPNIKYYTGDITQPATIVKAMAGCEQAYHIAGYARLWAAKRRTFYDINVTGTENVLKAALDAGTKRFVFTSSCAVFGPSYHTPLSETDPRLTAYDNDYDLSKCLAERVVREYSGKGLHAVIVNPSRVYGPGKATHANMITKMLVKVLRGERVLMPGIMNVTGNYAYIDDVVDGHINAMRLGQNGERYIVGGENLTYKEVITIIREEIPKAKLLPLPAAAVKAWGHAQMLKYYLTGNHPDFTPDASKRYLQDAAFDCSKAIADIDYNITSFRNGIRNTLAFLNCVHPQLSQGSSPEKTVLLIRSPASKTPAFSSRIPLSSSINPSPSTPPPAASSPQII